MKTMISIPNKMHALVLREVGKLEYEEVNVPELKEGTVLVNIKASGICSSDIERVFVTGTYHFPTIPGHEFSGQIVAVGDNVDESLLGKRTCVFPLLPCMECEACKEEKYVQCSNYNYFGSRCDGGFAEYLVVPTWNLIPFDDSLDYEKAALCEVTAVSLHAINRGNLKGNETVAVIGTGTIGYIIGSIAAAKGAKVIMCGRSEKKLAFAKELGFDTVDVNSETFEKDILALTNGSGCNLCYEAVGTEDSLSNAIKASGNSGTIVLVGNPKGNMSLEKNVYWKILRKELNVVGTWNSSYNSKVNDWENALELLNSDLFDFSKLITKVYDMEQKDEAFETLRDKDTFSVKVMFKNK